MWQMASDAVRLEDVDLKGKSTWRGPVVATSSTSRER
jgi:hypothetical protein